VQPVVTMPIQGVLPNHFFCFSDHAITHDHPICVGLAFVASLYCATACGAMKNLFGAFTARLRRLCSLSLASALTLKSCLIRVAHGCGIALYEKNQIWCGGRCGFPPFAKAAKDGSPTVWLVEEKSDEVWATRPFSICVCGD